MSGLSYDVSDEIRPLGGFWVIGEGLERAWTEGHFEISNGWMEQSFTSEDKESVGGVSAWCSSGYVAGGEEAS